MEPRSLEPKQSIAWAVFAFLLVVGVVGRIYQPQWNVTPIMAATLFSGVFFTRAWMAALLPTLSLAISNLWLPSYQAPLEMYSVYACFFVPLLFRPWVQRRMNVSRVLTSTISSALIFFVITNLAVWYVNCGSRSTDVYSKDFAGLMECYAYGIPFLRWWLQGDLFYMSVIFGSWALVSRTAIVARMLNVGVKDAVLLSPVEKAFV